MTEPLAVAHDHLILRVLRAGWGDAADASYSRQRADNRWNTRDFPALYCCCSVPVARAVALDVFRLANVVVGDLQPEIRPALARLSWSGQVVDVASGTGVAAAGFPVEYPADLSKEETRRAAVRWHERGHEGVLCRSASVWRRAGRRFRWEGPHEPWGELAIFPERARQRPREQGRRADLGWLGPEPASSPRPD